MTKILKKGQRVKTYITRTGGTTIEVIGKIKELKNAFGRVDVVIKGGKTAEFMVNEKSVDIIE